MGWYRMFCCFSSRNKKPIQGWLSRSSFATHNISYCLNHCFSSRNKKPIQGWLPRSSFTTNNISYSLNHCFSSKNKKPTQGWLPRSSFSTNNSSYSLNHCFSSRNKKAIQGWLPRSSFSIDSISYSLNHCFSSRNKKPIQGWLPRSSFSTNNISYFLNPRPMFSKSIVSQPTFWKSARFQSINPFLNRAGAKRFYYVDRYQVVSHFRRLGIAFSVISGFVISACCLILIFLKLNLNETVPYTKRSRIMMVTWRGERKTHKLIFEGLGDELPLDHPDSIRIRGIAHNIIDALQRDLKTENPETKNCNSWHLWDGLEFIVVDGPIELCRCFGSRVVVSRGLLDHFTSDAEIATIIGHEVGHIVGRHLAEKVTKMILWSFPYLVDDSYLANLLSFFERLPFSRRLELEADYIGIMLMASAGYDPRVAPQVYEKLGEINHNSTSLELISRHPLAKTRVQLLYEKLGEIIHNNNSILSEFFARYPHAKMRVQLLTRDKVMRKALCRYREAQRIRS